MTIMPGIDPSPASPLVLEIAGRLRADLVRFRDNPASLPSLTRLAAHYGVSFPTAAKAARLLAQERLVRIFPGRRLSLPSEAQPPAKPRVDAAERVEGQIQEQLLQGRIQAGQALPKVEYYVREQRVARATVVRALVRLKEAGLIRKEGKRWVVGRTREDLHAGRTNDNSFVLLVVQPKSLFWSNLKRGWDKPFVLALASEADRHGVRLAPCRMQEEPDPYHGPTGRQATAAFVRGLESRYAGALLLGGPRDYDRFEETLAHLLKFGKRVAWLDSSGTITLTLPASVRPRFYPCRSRNGDMEVAAVEYLMARGHRHWGYAGWHSAPWVAARGARLAGLLAEKCPGSRIWTYKESRNRLLDKGKEQLAAHLAELHRAGHSRARKTVAYFLHALGFNLGKTPHSRRISLGYRRMAAFLSDWAPLGTDPKPLWDLRELVFFLLDEHITVIVATRDYSVSGIHKKILQIGIEVPRELSLLSFDNVSDPIVLPVDSVDRGMGDLGRRTFHALLGDLRVPRDRNGGLCAISKVRSRGSVARLD